MALNYEMPVSLSFGLKPQVFQGSYAPEKEAKRVAFVHGTSRADKEWPFEHWVALGQRLKAQGLGVDLLHGTDAEEARSHALAQRIDGAVVWPRLSLDDLTDRMASCTGVIGVDSGLSHIAVALDVPHVQIYNFDTAWRTGPLPQGAQDRHVHQKTVFAQLTPDVNAVWQAWTEVAP
jgi:heptosyltransferase-1